MKIDGKKKRNGKKLGWKKGELDRKRGNERVSTQKRTKVIGFTT